MIPFCFFSGHNSNKPTAKWNPVTAKGLDERGFLWASPGETELGTQRGEDLIPASPSRTSVQMCLPHAHFCCPTIAAGRFGFRQVLETFQFAQKRTWGLSLEFPNRTYFLHQILVDLYSAGEACAAFGGVSGGWPITARREETLRNAMRTWCHLYSNTKPSSHRFALRLQVVFTDTVTSGQLEKVRQCQRYSSYLFVSIIRQQLLLVHKGLWAAPDAPIEQTLSWLFFKKTFNFSRKMLRDLDASASARQQIGDAWLGQSSWHPLGGALSQPCIFYLPSCCLLFSF